MKPLGFYGLDYNDYSLQLSSILETTSGENQLTPICTTFLTSYCSFLHHSYQSSQLVNEDEEEILWLMVIGDEMKYSYEEQQILLQCRDLIFHQYVIDPSQVLPIMKWLINSL